MIFAICVIYVVLGCVLESMSMILLTVPMFYPVVAHLGFDLVWFGIIVVVVTEISLITPPVGLNVFVLRGVLPDIPTATVFRGVLPFVGADSRAGWRCSGRPGDSAVPDAVRALTGARPVPSIDPAARPLAPLHRRRRRCRPRARRSQAS